MSEDSWDDFISERGMGVPEPRHRDSVSLPPAHHGDDLQAGGDTALRISLSAPFCSESTPRQQEGVFAPGEQASQAQIKADYRIISPSDRPRLPGRYEVFGRRFYEGSSLSTISRLACNTHQNLYSTRESSLADSRPLGPYPRCKPFQYRTIDEVMLPDYDRICPLSRRKLSLKTLMDMEALWPLPINFRVA
jgi:hypothetical protein